MYNYCYWKQDQNKNSKMKKQNCRVWDPGFRGYGYKEEGEGGGDRFKLENSLWLSGDH